MIEMPAHEVSWFTPNRPVEGNTIYERPLDRLLLVAADLADAGLRWDAARLIDIHHELIALLAAE